MNSRAAYYLLFAVFVLVLACASPAAACSCARQRLPCAAFGAANAVFIGKVVGAKEQRKQKNEDGSFTKYDVGEVYFQVEEAFLGVKGPRVVIHSGTGGGDCGYWFLRGQRYLVYAYGDSQNSLGTGICTRTRPLAEAEEDVAFLHNLPRKGTGARIFGSVVAAIKDQKAPARRTPKPLSGLTVKIEGQQNTFDAVTDAEGKYELTGLPGGKYKVYAEVPDYFHRDEYWVREIELNDRGCAQLDFFAQNDSRITGRVIGPDGKSLAKAHVQLLPVEKIGDSVNRLDGDEGWTDEQGEYEVAEIAPGRYLVGFNLAFSPDAEAPYPRTFYPGVAEPAAATVIEIGLGAKLSGIDIQLPARLTEQVVRGFVTWPDGSLAVGVDIHLEDVDYPGWCLNGCSQKTDSQGRFELRGYTGYTYKVMSLADKSAKHTENVYGESTDFKLSADVDGMKIVLSQSGRPWDKKEKK